MSTHTATHVHNYVVKSSAPNERGTAVRTVWACQGCPETRVERERIIPSEPKAEPKGTAAMPLHTASTGPLTPVTIALTVHLPADVWVEAYGIDELDLALDVTEYVETTLHNAIVRSLAVTDDRVRIDTTAPEPPTPITVASEDVTEMSTSRLVQEFARIKGAPDPLTDERRNVQHVRLGRVVTELRNRRVLD